MSPSTFSFLPPEETAQAIKNNPHAQLIDVREPGEFDTEFVPGAMNTPLSAFPKFVGKLKPDAPVYVLCQVGVRAQNAADTLLKKNFSHVYVVTGGMNLWKHAGLPVTRGTRNVWDLNRQVRFVAGLLVLAGIALSFINKWFLGVGIFVGCGLVFSGLTGWCGMALLLARMPWNKSNK